jgi:hypothetical protein
MAGIKIGANPSDVSLAFPVLPAGEYLCTVGKCEVTEVNKGDNKGKPMLVAKLATAAEVTADVGGKPMVIPAGRELLTFRATLFHIEKSPEMSFRGLKQLQEACGGGDTGWRGGELFPSEFEGRQVVAVVEIKEGDNGAFNQVKSVKLPA